MRLAIRLTPKNETPPRAAGYAVGAVRTSHVAPDFEATVADRRYSVSLVGYFAVAVTSIRKVT